VRSYRDTEEITQSSPKGKERGQTQAKEILRRKDQSITEGGTRRRQKQESDMVSEKKLLSAVSAGEGQETKRSR